MKNLVLNCKGQPCTTSRLVAEKFGKGHRNVLASIREIINSAENSAQFYELTSYKDSSGKDNPIYIMNRDGFSLLVMGFTGEKALQFKIDFIIAFNKMENLLHAGIDKLTRKDLAKMAYDSEVEKEKLQEQNQLQLKELKEAAPKVEYHDEVLTANNTHTITTIAKELGMSGQALNKLLHRKGIFSFRLDIGCYILNIKDLDIRGNVPIHTRLLRMILKLLNLQSQRSGLNEAENLFIKW